MSDLQKAADAFIVAWDSLTTVDLALAEPFVEALRQALAEPPNSTTDVVEPEPYNGWVLRNVYFEDGEPLMHSEPENTRLQELFGKTETLEAEIKRLQELADYRLNLLTKMPSEWVGLTDEELKPLCDEWRIIFGAHVNMFAREIESKLKEKNCG